jgi:LysM repeat protein
MIRYSEAQHNVPTHPERPKPPTRPNYAVRRGVALLFAALVAVGAVKAGEGVVDVLDGPNNPNLEKGAPNTHVHVVKAGETGWSIADDVLPDSADLRPVAYDIEDQNPGKLKVGEQVIVPDKEK